ncbi:MAG TPA: hypothetical protein VNN17_09485 [Terriglobia bacterium]|nr:hypothetical protein [Terriglobia bacterium]
MKQRGSWKVGVFGGVLLLGMSLGAQAQMLPEGPGKDVVATVCTNCHSLENVVTLRLSRQEWSGLVNDMIARGAPAFDDQFEIITNYLATNFGPDSKIPAAGSAAGSGNRNQPVSAEAAPGAGKTLVDANCEQCHALSYVTNARHSPEEWRSIVNDMVARGAALENEEIEIVVRYLADNYGPAGAATASASGAGGRSPGAPAASSPGLPEGPGKELVATVCTQCHGLNNVVTLRLTAEEWSGLVNDMIARGAPAFDDQYKTIIQYLSANFGKQ